MRNILLVLALFTAGLASAQTSDIVFKEKGPIFKDLKEGDILEFYYYFENTGSKDFVISGVHPTCGCTAAEFPKYTIKPGQQDSIKVTFNTDGRPGYNAKGVNMHTSHGEINLVFEAYVISKDGRVPE